MKQLLLSIACVLIFQAVRSQEGSMDSLKAIHEKLVTTTCKEGKGDLISHKAMSLYLAREIGYYLSEYNDLSFYKNYITLNAASGIFSLNHNLYQPQKTDEPISSFMVVGVRANIADAFRATLSQKQFNNQLGATFQVSFLGKVTTFHHGKCENGVVDTDKQAADLARSYILHETLSEWKTDADKIEKITNMVTATDVPGQDLDTAKKRIRASQFTSLEELYRYRFASRQADFFQTGTRFRRLSTSWTNISVYIPLITQKFIVAPNVNEPIRARYSYPPELGVMHVRYEDFRSVGRFFLKLYAGGLINSNAANNTLPQITKPTYISSGGQDIADINRIGADMLYFGNFKNYLIARLSAELIYFPTDSHIGVSMGVDSKLGDFRTTDGFVGIPITLIDKRGIPAADFQFQVRFHDLSSDLSARTSLGNKISIGATFGVPFSKIIY